MRLCSVKLIISFLSSALSLSLSLSLSQLNFFCSSLVEVDREIVLGSFFVHSKPLKYSHPIEKVLY